MSINFVLNDSIDCSATAVFYIALSDVSNVFQFQTDASINDVSSNDIKYFVDVSYWPTNVNAANAMMDVSGHSTGAVATSDINGTYPRSTMLVSDDYIRYLALRLFNTHHGVDLFNNVDAMQANIVSICQSNSRDFINGRLNQIDMSAGTLSMSGVSPALYLTNANITVANMSRGLMLQIEASQPQRFSSIAGSGRQKVPLLVNDSLNFKVTLNAAAGQYALTNVAAIPNRSYKVKMIIVDTPTNTVSTSL